MVLLADVSGLSAVNESDEDAAAMVGGVKGRKRDGELRLFLRSRKRCIRRKLPLARVVKGTQDPTERLPWLQRWWELAGEAQIAYFDASGNGISYMLGKHGPEDR